MNRRGFVLLTVLWTIVALAAVAGAAARLARIGTRVTANRILLSRAAWARDGCGEILAARFAADAAVRQVETVDLGRDTWCRVEMTDQSAALDVNDLGADRLREILTDSLVHALIDWRDPDTVASPLGAEAEWYRARRRAVPRNGPIADVAELPLIRGFEHVPPAVIARLTTRAAPLVARLEGGVHGSPLIASAVLTLVPVQNRLAVIARASD